MSHIKLVHHVFLINLETFIEFVDKVLEVDKTMIY